MLVIVLENAPARLRGILTLWMLEIRAGVYVGKINKRLRQRLWKRVKTTIDEDNQGNAAIAWTKRNEAGFLFDTHGENRRIPIDVDGLQLVQFQPLEEEESSEQITEEAQMRNFLARRHYEELGDEIYFEDEDDHPLD